MIINYQYNSLHVLSPNSAAPEGDIEYMDDSDWAACFGRLTVEGRDVAVRCNDPRRLVAHLQRNYINIKAAGAIVEDNRQRRLLMQRNGRSDLPKGKVEAGETLLEAAMRETNEETGLCGLQAGPLLLKTYHIYNLYGGWHFKQTTWFAAKVADNARLVPQTDEGITELLWLPADEWRNALQTSYATMRVITSQISDMPLFSCDG